MARAFRGLALSTWLLLVVGASVRVHGAGMACPDWPLCFGELVPRMDFRIFLEWGHRLLAGFESVGLLVLGLIVFRDPGLRAKVGGWVLATGAVLLLQIVLGGLTVLHLLAEWSVTSHLLAGNLFFLMLALTAQRLDPPQRAPTPAAGVSAALAVLVFLQVGLGGFTSSSEAGLACTEWPTCNGGVWFPTFTGIVGLHLLHRLGGYTVLALALAQAWLLRGHPMGRRAALLAAGVLLQAGLGIANVLLALPVELAIAHSALADLLLLLSVTTATALVPSPSPSLHLERA